MTIKNNKYLHMKNIIISMVVFTLMGVTTSKAKNSVTAKGFNHIESVASDGKFIYIADIGKELNPI